MEINTDNRVKSKSYVSLIKAKTYMVVKRMTDVIVSLLALIVLFPVFMFVLFVDYFTKLNKGPVLFKQVRVGLNGKKFGMYKFRSMVVNADIKLKNNADLYKKYVKNNYKLEPKDDPRITTFGRMLRLTSIDEIPQFINILRGDMSLVGPRPVVEAELVEYDVEKLLSVKPGAMGLWQATGRSKIGYPDRAKIEMRYIDNASVRLDTKVFFRNLMKIIEHDGAY